MENVRNSNCLFLPESSIDVFLESKPEMQPVLSAQGYFVICYFLGTHKRAEDSLIFKSSVDLQITSH